MKGIRQKVTKKDLRFDMKQLEHSVATVYNVTRYLDTVLFELLNQLEQKGAISATEKNKILGRPDEEPAVENQTEAQVATV